MPFIPYSTLLSTLPPPSVPCHTFLEEEEEVNCCYLLDIPAMIACMVLVMGEIGIKYNY
jgi:hypothetical protein